MSHWLRNCVEVTCFQGEVDELLRELTSEGFHIIKLDNVKSGNEFFQVARNTFPLTPPISGRISWDAFADSFFEGILGQAENKIAVVWQRAHEMAIADPAQFQHAESTFGDVSQQLSKYGKRLLVFLLDDGHCLKKLGFATSRVTDEKS